VKTLPSRCSRPMTGIFRANPRPRWLRRGPERLRPTAAAIPGIPAPKRARQTHTGYAFPFNQLNRKRPPKPGKILV
jgi:hypothetical protein